MYILELNDIFFIRNLNYPHEGFNINSYISFAASGDTRAAANHKLQHNASPSHQCNYFNRLPRL